MALAALVVLMSVSFCQDTLKRLLVPLVAVPDQVDIQWRLLNQADGLCSTALASFYAPHEHVHCNCAEY